MKRMGIKLTTKAQRDAREQAKLAAATTPGITDASKNSAQKSAKSPVEKTQAQSVAPRTRSRSASREPQLSLAEVPKPAEKQTSRPPTPSTPQPALPSRISHLQDASAVPLPPSSPAAAPPAPAIPANENVFIPYQPEGPAPAPSAIQQEPLKWLPPNTATPSPMKRADLPTFTATGPIPFAAPVATMGVAPTQVPAPGTMTVKQENVDKKATESIWDVPGTPGR